MAVAEETGGSITMMDDTYEFSAPRFFDFILGESEEDTRKAELWFETALSYAPSPFMPKIKNGRSLAVERLCDFSDANKIQEISMTSNSESAHSSEAKEDAPAIEGRVSSGGASVEIGKDTCTPNPPVASAKTTTATNSKKQTAKKIAALIKNPSAIKTKSQVQSSAMKNPSGIKTKAQLQSSAMKSTTGTSQLAQENQAIKRQKLEGGRTRQILNAKPLNLPHKSKLGSTTSNASISFSSTSKSHKEERKVYVRETPIPASVPFVSMAEMMRRFQSSTRDLSLPNATTLSRVKPKLTLTRPKEPEFETSQRVRSQRVKSSAELEKEMMAKMPKFKARPVNKKILQAPTLPPVTRSTPQPPEFKEFHLETMARAQQNADSTSVASTEFSHRGNPWKPHLTEPKTPLLQTSLRARPAKLKSSIEIEQEELEKIPRFKARPLNKKIFESKGDIGIFCHTKKHVTQPQEFHFATNDRILPPASVADLFDKLSLNSEPTCNNKKPIPRNTTPNPFHLYTEERGAEKEKKLLTELVQKQLEEERARIPKANPYPYTTDYPVVPLKPEPKQCTNPEPFQLESLVRHEEEMLREMEERRRMEREEAQMRIFKAQPILKEDLIPVPEKVRKPLTQVQVFDLNVDHRAVDRAEFDQKIKEKEMMYKRYREESEAAKMMEEEKELKQLRRTMVPHARPVPKFDNPFCPQKSSKEATKPKSPTLRVLHRKERRQIFSGTAVSSPAASMR